MKRAVFLLLAGLVVAAPAPAQEPLREVLSVYDGDTARIRGYAKSVRFLGYDTPERGHRAKCPLERRLADEARAAFQEETRGGVALARGRDPRGRLQPNLDRYGRPLRAGTLEDGRALAAAMIARRSSDGRVLAVEYWGERLHHDWCKP